MKNTTQQPFKRKLTDPIYKSGKFHSLIGLFCQVKWQQKINIKRFEILENIGGKLIILYSLFQNFYA